MKIKFQKTPNTPPHSSHIVASDDNGRIFARIKRASLVMEAGSTFFLETESYNTIGGNITDGSTYTRKYNIENVEVEISGYGELIENTKELELIE